MTPPWGPRRRWHPVHAGPPSNRQPGRGTEEHTVRLPTHGTSVTLARRTAQIAFTRFGLAPSSVLMDTVLLIATELVTNSVRHATGSPHLNLTLGLSPTELTIAVHDEDPTLPPWPPAVHCDAARQGLAMLADLVAAQGGHLDLQPDHAAPGKTVRATLPRA